MSTPNLRVNFRAAAGRRFIERKNGTASGWQAATPKGKAPDNKIVRGFALYTALTGAASIASFFSYGFSGFSARECA